MAESGQFPSDLARLNGAALAPAALAPLDTAKQAIFDQRARTLAAPPDVDTLGDTHEALVFHLGDERYAVAANEVAEVRLIGHLTQLPGAPPFVAGLVNLRGRIVPVLDLRPLFGLPAPAEATVAIVFLAGQRGIVGVLTTSRPEIRSLADVSLTSLPAGSPAGLDPIYVRGVTTDFVVLLNAARLLADPRLIVEDDTR